MKPDRGAAQITLGLQARKAERVPDFQIQKFRTLRLTETAANREDKRLRLRGVDYSWADRIAPKPSIGRGVDLRGRSSVG